jgi:hypothetical protein
LKRNGFDTLSALFLAVGPALLVAYAMWFFISLACNLDSLTDGEQPARDRST